MYPGHHDQYTTSFSPSKMIRTAQAIVLKPFNCYNSALDRHPLSTKCLTSGVMYAGSSSAASSSITVFFHSEVHSAVETIPEQLSKATQTAIYEIVNWEVTYRMKAAKCDLLHHTISLFLWKVVTSSHSMVRIIIAIWTESKMGRKSWVWMSTGRGQVCSSEFRWFRLGNDRKW